jgi:hypothetical protein
MLRVLPQAPDFAGEVAGSIDDLARAIHADVSANGHWALACEQAGVPDWAIAALKSALIASECSELLEEYRAGTERDASKRIPDFTREEDEIADIFIRALDLAGARGLKLGHAVAAKLLANRSRPRAHGGKRF